MRAILESGRGVGYDPGMSRKTPTPKEILADAGHRPYPAPTSPWVMRMRWYDLLFMHWRIPYGSLRPLIPRALELDSFDGDAWLGVVPFRMSGVRPRFLPEVPMLSDFPELNVRTYVTAGGRPGVYFFSLDAHSPVAVRMARLTFGLPYFDAAMYCRTAGEWVIYGSRRTHRGAPGAELSGRYRAVGEPFGSRPGSLESFLTERYCLYGAGVDGKGRVRRGEIQHRLWPLQPAEAEIDRLEMTAQIGLELPPTDPILHFSRRLDVLAWPPRALGETEVAS